MRQLLRRIGLFFERQGPIGGLKVLASWPQLVEQRKFQLVSFGPSKVGRELEKEQKIAYLEINSGLGWYTRWRPFQLHIGELGKHAQLVINPPEHLRDELIRAGVPIVAENKAEIRAAMNSALMRKKIAAKQSRTLLLKMSEEAGLDMPLISVIVSTNRPNQLEHVKEQYARQTYPNKELIILTHGFEAEGCLSAPASASLGSCLNTLVLHSNGEVVAKFDDDDLYLPDYLLDQYLAMWDNHAEVVGKAANYIYFSSTNALALRRAQTTNQFTNFVAGATLMACKEIFEKFPFADVTRGEDTDFLRRLESAGVPVFSTNQFNFIVLRHGEHTWSTADHLLVQSAEVETFGLNEEHVRV